MRSFTVSGREVKISGHIIKDDSQFKSIASIYTVLRKPETYRKRKKLSTPCECPPFQWLLNYAHINITTEYIVVSHWCTKHMHL